jgi:ceramide glucosyltransferase
VTAQPWLDWCGTALTGLAMVYGVTAGLAVRLRRSRTHSGPATLPPATVLKPLCGAEPELYDCLCSFCDQAYPRFQIVFGVRAPEDPAVSVVQRLQREFPRRDLQITITPTQHGSSGKVSNLINMMPFARYDYLVVADSDVCVPRDYLARVVPPLLDTAVGIVTCPYRGCPLRGAWSVLGSAFINDWFMPSVHVAALLGSRAFAFGATIALPRSALASACARPAYRSSPRRYCARSSDARHGRRHCSRHPGRCSCANAFAPPACSHPLGSSDCNGPGK